MRTGSLLRASVAMIVVLNSTVGAIPAASAGPQPGRELRGAVRVDQLGYAPSETKLAYLLATAAVDGARFQVVDESGRVALRGSAAPSRGPWNDTYTAVHALDISALHVAGTYRIVVSGPLTATSPSFEIGSAERLFRPRVGDGVAFFSAQRDGGNVVAGPLHRQPSHLNDRALTVFDWPTYENPDSDVIVGDALTATDGPVNLEGGWFDAGDFIKFTHTTAYAVGLMYAAQRELGDDAPASLLSETRFGQQWLERAWDQKQGILYIQVGIGSGNQDGTFAGDHDVWRLPEKDDSLTGRENRYLRHRPAFRATTPGGQLPPNLAGRMSAAFALAAQIDATRDLARARRELDLAADLFGRAKTNNVAEADVVTALPHAFYPELSWRDDLEWGAAELALAGERLHDPRSQRWLQQAVEWASQYLADEAGGDTFNLYDTSALAHADLTRAIQVADHPGGLAVSQRRLIADLEKQLEVGSDRAAADPFGAGSVYDDFDVASHTFGLIVTARLYRALTGDRRFDSFATQQRDWVLGANPWGASLMIGVGQTFPNCPQHVVANLAGSIDGTPPYLRGAVVNGPNSQDLFADGLGDFFEEGVTCPADGVDRYAEFTGRGSQFVDDVRAWQTVEPAIDFTAAAILAFALLQ